MWIPEQVILHTPSSHVQLYCLRVRLQYAVPRTKGGLACTWKRNASIHNVHQINYGSVSVICSSTLNNRRSVADSLPICHSPTIEHYLDYSTRYGVRDVVHMDSDHAYISNSSQLEVYTLLSTDQWNRDRGVFESLDHDVYCSSSPKDT